MVTAIARGVATISAETRGVKGGTELVVDPPAAYFKVLGPATVGVGEGLVFTVEAFAADGTRLRRPGVAWSADAWNQSTYSGGPGAATVDSTGRVTGRQAGWVLVHAVVEGLSTDADLFVHEPAASARLGADTLRLSVGQSIVPRRLYAQAHARPEAPGAVRDPCGRRRAT